jgi:HEPN domain-containing protein
MVGMNRLEFQDLAVERLGDADALLKPGRFACAYYISGYAIECALKACVARQTKQDDFPPKDAARLYTHDLPKLLDSAGLGWAFEQEAGQDPIFEKNWTTVKE